MAKKKSKEYIKGFKAGWMWLLQHIDIQLRESEEELDEVIYEMTH